MANHLRVAMIHAILTLHQRGWSKRRIARELGVDRGSVARSLLASSPGGDNPPHGSPPEADASNAATGEANPPLGSNADLKGLAPPSDKIAEGAKAATNPPPGSKSELVAFNAAVAGPPSTCERFRTVIEEKVAQGLSGRRIYQDLVQEQGEEGAPSYDSIKRFLRHLRRSTPVPFRRMEVAPGQEAQVDFGAGVPVVGVDGRRRDCKKITKHLGIPLGGRDGTGKPIFRADLIEFNGRAPDEYETFAVDRVVQSEAEPMVFEFCKTEHRPYDLCVQATLIVLKHHLGKAINVSSDGSDTDWGVARKKCQTHLGYGGDFKLEK